MSILPIHDPNRGVLGRAHDLLMRGLDAQQSASRHLPRRRQCHLLEIWGETGPRARSPTGSGAESDTALLCCTPLGHRPLRRFKEEEGCCCFLLRGERCCWGDRGAWRDGPKRTASGAHWLRPSSSRGRWRGWKGFILTGWGGLQSVSAQLAGVFLVAVRRAKLDVKAQNDSLHHWNQWLWCCSVLLVALSDAVSLSLFCVILLFPVGCGGGCASGPGEGEMLLEGQWGKAATAPSTDGQRKGVVCIRLFKVVPTAQHPRKTRGRKPEPRAAASHPSRAMTDGFITLCKNAAARPSWCND